MSKVILVQTSPTQYKIVTSEQLNSQKYIQIIAFGTGKTNFFEKFHYYKQKEEILNIICEEFPQFINILRPLEEELLSKFRIRLHSNKIYLRNFIISE